MTVGTTTDLLFSTADILQLAFNEAGIVGLEQPMTANLQTFGNKMLNALLKSWQSEGIYPWCSGSGTLFLVPGTNTYSIGSTGTPCPETDSVVSTTTNQGALLNATTIYLTSVTGISTGMNVGITLDTGFIQWTTVSTINTGSSYITVPSTGLTSTAASGNAVYFYITNIVRPLELTDAQVRINTSTGQPTDRPIDVISRQEYYDFPNKYNQSTFITHIYYNPERDTLGSLKVYQTPSSSAPQIIMQYRRPFYLFDSIPATQDFPSEWGLALIFGLAAIICPAAGKDAKLKASLTDLANQYLSAAQAGSGEVVSTMVRGRSFD